MHSTTQHLRRNSQLQCTALASLTILGLSSAGGPIRAETLHHAPVGSGWARVIITLKGPLTGQCQARLDALKADTYRHLPLIHAVALRLPQRNISRLASLPFVRHVSHDVGVTKCDEFTTGSSGATSAWQQYRVTGAGVTVAVLDSGIKEHEDLNNSKQKGNDEDDSFNGSNILVHQDMTGAPPPDGQDDDAQPLYDLCGHGTHVAGIIAGNGRASTGKRFFHTFYGIAPQAGLVDVRVLDANGRSDISTVIAGLQWVVNNKSQYHIRVVNLSLGHPVGESYATDPLCQAVESAWKAGIVVVCAAGNSGRTNITNRAGDGNEGWGTNYGSINSPANDPYVIAVGATKQDTNHSGDKNHDRIATYSGRGPSRLDLVLKPDLIAPGNRVTSLEASKDYLSTNYNFTNQVPLSSYLLTKQTAPSDKYFSLSGTSMAAPVVAGAAALLLQADPTLTPDTVKARLMLSADKWTAPDGTLDLLTYGAGYLDIPAALASAAKATLPALSPMLTLNSDGSLAIVMDRAAWGSTAATGSRAVSESGIWGTGITDLRAAWGSSVSADRAATGSGGTVADRAAWGSNAAFSSRAAWTSSVWGDRAAWGSSSSAVDLSNVALTGEALPSNWGAKAISAGPDGRMSVLWNNADGTVSVWSANPSGGFTHAEYGPSSGWVATAIAAGPDGLVHLLWTNTTNQIALWTLDGRGGFTHKEYGPYSGWSAQAIALGPDNMTHVLWSHINGTVSLWNVDAQGGFAHAEYGPYSGWSPKSFSYGPDNIAHVLWAKGDSTVSLWALKAQGQFAHSEFGPYLGWTVQAIATGGDNITHLLWSHTGDNQASLWQMSAAGGFAHTEYGPYAGWAPNSLSAGSDGSAHVLWNQTNGTVSLWNLYGDGSFASQLYGPY